MISTRDSFISGAESRRSAKLAVKVAAAPNDTVATAGSDGSIRIWDTRTREVRVAYPFDDAPVEELEFSSDGRWLAWFGNGVLHIVSCPQPTADER